MHLDFFLSFCRTLRPDPSLPPFSQFKFMAEKGRIKVGRKDDNNSRKQRPGEKVLEQPFWEKKVQSRKVSHILTKDWQHLFFWWTKIVVVRYGERSVR